MPMPAEPAELRVLMTADAVGGVWSYAMDLASGLQAAGAQVTVAVMGPAMRERHRHEAASRGIDVVERPCRLEWMPDCWADVDSAGAWLMSLADRCRPDLVHLNGFAHAALPWRVPVVVVAHSCVRTWWRGVHGEDPPRTWDTYTQRVTDGLRGAHLLVAPTRALLDDVGREYGVTAPCRVIPNGSSSVSPTRATAAKEPLVFAAGRLWDDAKNMSALSAAASCVAWPVYLAGDVQGPSGSCAYTGAARYLGALPPQAMTQWFDRASIYALPARYEPFGLSIVEAAAAGCALVLGDIRTLRENWSGAALFVPPDNRRALAGAINELIRDADHREALAARARERALQFTVPAMAGAYLSAYSGLLAPAAVA